MADKIETSELQRCIQLADKLTAGLEPAVREVAFGQILHELLDNEYVDDLGLIDPA